MPDTPRGQVWPVGALCLAIADALHTRFNPVAVEGEIGGFTRAASGHLYFSLKDSGGQLRCAMFRRAASLLGFVPQEGERVVVRGRLGVYEARGDLQLVAESLERAGQGNLYEQFLRLKEALAREGLFDAARKRTPLPIPRGIAVVTSPNAAAWHDVATTLRRRAPHVPVVLVPSLVQGAEAPAALCEALTRLYAGISAGTLVDARSGQTFFVDTILLVRGGGAIEDLWAFNDAGLARLIVQSPVPVVCGVGHETDVTIADWCADVRAPTPTAAAEVAAQDVRQLQMRNLQLEEALAQATDSQLAAQQRRIQRLTQTLARPRSQTIHQHGARLHLLRQALRHATRQSLARSEGAIERLEQALPKAAQLGLQIQQHALANAELRLRMLDPQHVLERGYAIVTKRDGRIVKQASQLSPGEPVQARFAEGTAQLLPTDARPPTRANGELF